MLNLLKNTPYKKYVENISSLKPMEGNKEDAHPAIHIVGYPREDLTKDEWKIYDLIAKRTIACFYDPMIRESFSAKIKIKDEIFKLSGSKTINKGWYLVYNFPKYEEININLKKGEKVKIKKIILSKKETQPPKRYTIAGIIKELEKRKLGTKATRAEIIDKLIKRGYVKEENGSLIVTDLGLNVIETLKKYCPEVIDEKLTGKMEEKLEKIQNKKLKKSDVLKEAEEHLKTVLEEFKKNEIQIGKYLSERLYNNNSNKYISSSKTCPKCGSLLVVKNGKFGKFYGCSNYPNCNYTESIPVGKCPKCSSPLYIKEGKYGKFIACSNYPICKYTEKLRNEGKNEKDKGNSSC